MRRVYIRSNSGKVLNDFLRVLRLTSTRLSCDQNTLVLSFLSHADPRPLGDSKDVGRVLVSSFITVLLDDGIGIEWEILVRVDGN